MTCKLRTSIVCALSLGAALLAGSGCGGDSGPPGLAVDVSFAPGVPRTARDEAVRVEVYLLDSCESVSMGDRPDDALARTYVMRQGTEGPLIDIPEAGDYGLYAVAQDSDCAVIGAACRPLTIEAGDPGPIPVELGSFNGQSCFPNQECSLETGDCVAGGGDCVDLDGDGLGDGTFGNVGCVDTTTDSDDGDATSCADTDGDGCDDCAIDTFDPFNDGLDADEDGVCATSDCDDDKPHCAADCSDMDGDGYCTDNDCDDTVSACDVDCATNTDGDEHVDCFEDFCGSDPGQSGSVCSVISNETEYRAAVNAANSTAGHDYIVLGDFTMTTGAQKFTDDAGATVRQLAGSELTVDSGGDRLVFELEGDNNVLDGIRVVNVLNARQVVVITGAGNTVENCEIEGFEDVGVYVATAANAVIRNNRISGGTSAEGSERGAVALNEASNALVSGNTLSLNTMDALKIRNSDGVRIDHNTIADNGGSALDFYSGSTTGVCMRNNNITGNGDLAIVAGEDDRPYFDTSAACTGPLSPGPAYGNNAFGNRSVCGGEGCLGCGCVPSGAFWEYMVDPSYRSSNPGDADFYCLNPSSDLVDGGHDLGYDRNGDATGDFNGPGPDVGSREDGAGDCN